MPDQVMECPRCRAAADLFAGSDAGLHYHCQACGCSFTFDVANLKVTVDEAGQDH